jgi:hypothetical protein
MVHKLEIKMTVFRDVAPCSLVKFADVSEVSSRAIRPDDGGNEHF